MLVASFCFAVFFFFLLFTNRACECESCVDTEWQARRSIIGSFLVVMGFQDGDQSYGVRPETGVLMDDGTVVEISNFFFSCCSHMVVFFLLSSIGRAHEFLLHFVASSVWVDSRHVRGARLPCRTRALPCRTSLRKCSTLATHEQLGSGQVVKDDMQYKGIGKPSVVPLREPDDGDCRRRSPSWPAVTIRTPL